MWNHISVIHFIFVSRVPFFPLSPPTFFEFVSRWSLLLHIADIVHAFSHAGGAVFFSGFCRFEFGSLCLQNSLNRTNASFFHQRCTLFNRYTSLYLVVNAHLSACTIRQALRHTSNPNLARYFRNGPRTHNRSCPEEIITFKTPSFTSNLVSTSFARFLHNHR